MAVVQAAFVKLDNNSRSRNLRDYPVDACSLGEASQPWSALTRKNERPALGAFYQMVGKCWIHEVTSSKLLAM